MIVSVLIPPPKAPIVTAWIHRTKINECYPSFLEKATKCSSQVILEHKQGLLSVPKLKKLNITYQQKYDYNPEFIVISHSHGESIIRHLADIKEKNE